MRFLRILLVIVVAMVTAGRARAAGEVGQGDAGIEDAINQGVALRRAGNDEVALTLFLNLQSRAPDSVRILLHIATAALATGKWIMAYDYLQKAETHRDDPYFQRHKAAIDAIEKVIAQRVGQFRVRGVPAGAEVRLSGELIGTLPMSSPRPVEVGSYQLEVTKPGYFPLRRPLTIASGADITQEAVELREQRPLVPAVAMGQTSLQAGSYSDPGANAAPSWWQSRWVTWSLAGIGVAAAATSVVAFAVREQNAARWNDDSSCLSSANANETRGQVCSGVRDTIDLSEGVGIGAGIAAVVFGGAAVVHWLAVPREHAGEPQPAPTGVQASCTPGLAGVACYGSF